MASMSKSWLRALPVIAAAASFSLHSGCNDNSFSGSAGNTAKAPGSGSSPTSGPTAGGTPTAGGNPTGGSPTGDGTPGSPTGSGNPTTGTGTSSPTTGSGTPTDCVKGDQVSIPFAGPEKDCFDSGKTWNFGANKCQDIRKAKFDCTWDNIIKWFGTTNLSPTTAIQNGQKDGRKVVSCGESEDGNRLVVIWLNPPAGGKVNCEDPKSISGLAVTGCYTYYPDPTKAPPDTTDDAVKKQRVYACMDNL